MGPSPFLPSLREKEQRKEANLPVGLPPPCPGTPESLCCPWCSLSPLTRENVPFVCLEPSAAGLGPPKLQSLLSLTLHPTPCVAWPSAGPKE